MKARLPAALVALGVTACAALMWTAARSRPHLRLRIQTPAVEAQIWIDRKPMGKTPLDIPLDDYLEQDPSQDRSAPPRSEIRTIIGREPFIELLVFLEDGWRTRPIRIEAGTAAPTLLDWIGETPQVERSWPNTNSLTLALRVGSNSSLDSLR